MTGLPPSGLKTWLPGSIRNTTGREMKWETNWRCTRNCGRIIRRKCAHWRADYRWRWMTTAGISTGNTTNRYIILFCCCVLLCLSVFTQDGSYNSVSNVFCRVGCANVIFLSGLNSSTIYYWCFYRGDKFEWFCYIQALFEKKKRHCKMSKSVALSCMGRLQADETCRAALSFGTAG